ncbi:ionotropic receptor 93a-like [Panulirus ornatus]|uniref:ionotropic receptor 93a-like n=1 Tax=Panulirus ornatus TaxID=150431 RepID=UPI003A864423
MLWITSGAVRQPMPQLPQGSWGCRLLLVAWWLAAVVLSTSYTGSITAFLTVPRQAPKIATLHDLAQANSKLFLLDYGAFLPGYLTTSVDPVYRALGQKLHLVESYDAIRVEMEAGHAFVEGRHYTQAALIRWRMADAYVVEEMMFPNYNGWAFRKGTPWTPMFNKYLLRMVESGLVNHWHRTILASFRRDHGLTPRLLEDNLLSLRPLSVSDSQGTFIIMGFGIALAIVGFILEFLHHRLRAREAGGHSLVKSYDFQ